MSARRHAKVSSLVQSWMVALADPVNPSDAPAEKLGAKDLTLLTQAVGLHGIGPIFFRNLEALIARDGIARIVTDVSAEKILDDALAEEKLRARKPASHRATAHRIGRTDWTRVGTGEHCHNSRQGGRICAAAISLIRPIARSVISISSCAPMTLIEPNLSFRNLAFDLRFFTLQRRKRILA